MHFQLILRLLLSFHCLVSLKKIIFLTFNLVRQPFKMLKSYFARFLAKSSAFLGNIDLLKAICILLSWLNHFKRICSTLTSYLVAVSTANFLLLQLYSYIRKPHFKILHNFGCVTFKGVAYCLWLVQSGRETHPLIKSCCFAKLNDSLLFNIFKYKWRKFDRI